MYKLSKQRYAAVAMFAAARLSSCLGGVVGIMTSLGPLHFWGATGLLAGQGYLMTCSLIEPNDMGRNCSVHVPVTTLMACAAKDMYSR